MSCLVVECDECGETFAPEDYTPHYETADEAAEIVAAFDWRTDGEHHWHEMCALTAHAFSPDPDAPSWCVRCQADEDEHDEAEGSTR